MGPAILLAFAASFCTATASVCQRRGARNTEVTGFEAGLILRLVHRPVWLAGIASMILGFGLQLTALRFGPLALVPVKLWPWPCSSPARPYSAIATWSPGRPAPGAVAGTWPERRR